MNQPSVIVAIDYGVTETGTSTTIKLRVDVEHNAVVEMSGGRPMPETHESSPRDNRTRLPNGF